MKILYTLIIFFIIIIQVSAQSCLPNGISFTTQEQIDNFQKENPGCTKIEGTVKISGNDIISLDSLNVLTSIDGYLIIGEYFGTGNPNLKRLNGLENLTSIEGDLSLYNNDSLLNLTGLDNLEVLNGSLWVHFNSSMINLYGLNKIKSIGQYVSIADNDAIINLSGLDSLESIDGDFIVQNNQILHDFSNLTHLNHVGGWVHIEKNPSLESLNGLDKIKYQNIEYLKISSNLNLKVCDVKFVCDYLFSGNINYQIENNNDGCNHKKEITDACASFIEDISLKKILPHPNPFSTSTAIEYTLTNPSEVNVSILNSFGELVHQVQEQQQPGKQQFLWDAEGLPSGMYYYQMEAGEMHAKGKMVKIRNK